MPRSTLVNYLRTHRRKAGFSQDEVAFLLGVNCGTAVSRHERSSREPNLKNALAYSIIYNTVANELYNRTCLEIRADLWIRVEVLAGRIKMQPRSKRNTRKLAMLDRLLQERTQ